MKRFGLALIFILICCSIAWAALMKRAQIGALPHVKGVVIETPANTDRFLLALAPDDWTVTTINCIADPADSDENVVIALYESDASGDFTNLATNGLDGTTQITCDNDGAADDGTLSNPSVDSGDWVGIDVDSVSGTVDFLTVTFDSTD